MKLTNCLSLTAKSRTIYCLVAAVIIAVSPVKAQDEYAYNFNIKTVSSGEKLSTNKYAEKNLATGIKSDIPGIRRNCIYYAGKYKISEMLFPLMEQMKKEKDPETRILIALSLNELDDARGLYLVKEMSLRDGNARVRRMCAAIYNDYMFRGNERLAAE